LRLSDGLSNLVEEEDVVIRIGNLDRSGANLIVRKLASYTSCLRQFDVFHTAWLPKHPDELAHHNCLLFTYSMGMTSGD